MAENPEVSTYHEPHLTEMRDEKPPPDFVDWPDYVGTWRRDRAKGWDMVVAYVIGVFLVGAGVYLLLRFFA